MSKDNWTKTVYEAVEAQHEATRAQRCDSRVTMERYKLVKDWSKVGGDRAEYSGEVGRLGALVVERYLDDVKDRLGTKLKLMCRAECLPVMARVAWELGVGDASARCVLCSRGEVEDIPHLILHCPAHQTQRMRMMEAASLSYARGNGGTKLEDLDVEEKLRVLLGAPAGCKTAAVDIDRATKRFLRKAWKTRRHLAGAINKEFERQDVVWTKREGGWNKPVPRQTATVGPGGKKVRQAEPMPAPSEVRSARSEQSRGPPVGVGPRRRLFY